MRFFRFLKEKYGLLASKRFTTVAGTLVFFLMTSIMPLAVWLTLLFGRLPLPVERIVEMPVFASVKGVLTFVRREAAVQSRGASVFLIVTALYSATGLFYHLRRSGEIIYGYEHKKSGVKLRLFATVFLFVVLIVSVVSVALVVGGGILFSRLFSPTLATLFTYLFMIAVSFGLVLLLNIYACPYRVQVKKFLFGSFVTAAAWAVALVGKKVGNA